MPFTPNPYLSQMSALVAASHKVARAGLSRGISGNLSLRTQLPDAQSGMLITPSGYALEEVDINSVCHITAQGEWVEACRVPVKPSSERLIHQAVYDARPDVGAVIHAHPLHATFLAGCHQTLDHHLIAESIYHLGQVPLVEYHLPGSAELASAIKQAVAKADVLILANHGVLVAGTDLRQAYYRLELLEVLAQMHTQATQLAASASEAKPQWLSPDQLKAIEALKPVPQTV